MILGTSLLKVFAFPLEHAIPGIEAKVMLCILNHGNLHGPPFYLQAKLSTSAQEKPRYMYVFCMIYI